MMIREISGPEAIQSIQGLDPQIEADAGVDPSVGFGEVLGAALERAAEAKSAAAERSDALARGAIDDIHGTMIAVKEAEITMKLVGTVRNKLLDAFQELWRTNV